MSQGILTLMIFADWGDLFIHIHFSFNLMHWCLSCSICIKTISYCRQGWHPLGGGYQAHFPYFIIFIIFFQTHQNTDYLLNVIWQGQGSLSYGFSKGETTLQCNVISHGLSLYVPRMIPNVSLQLTCSDTCQIWSELKDLTATLQIGNILNTLRPRQNGHHFADDTFKRIFLNENVRIPIKISLKFVPKGAINNIPALV